MCIAPLLKGQVWVAENKCLLSGSWTILLKCLCRDPDEVVGQRVEVIGLCGLKGSVHAIGPRI